MRLIKAALIDFDGTIADTNEIIIQSHEYALKKVLNISVARKDIIKYFGETVVDTMKRYDSTRVDELMDAYKYQSKSVYKKMIKIMGRADEAMAKLKRRKIKIAVVTSRRKDSLEKGLEILKLTNLVDGIIACEDIEKGKPDGEPAEKACKLLGVKPEESLMVGDSYYDILCGRNAGCHTAVVSYTLLDMNKIKKYKPDFYLKDLMDLDDIIK